MERPVARQPPVRHRNGKDVHKHVTTRGLSPVRTACGLPAAVAYTASALRRVVFTGDIKPSSSWQVERSASGTAAEGRGLDAMVNSATDTPSTLTSWRQANHGKDGGRTNEWHALRSEAKANHVVLILCAPLTRRNNMAAWPNWIRHPTTDREILGSSPRVVIFLIFSCVSRGTTNRHTFWLAKVAGVRHGWQMLCCFIATVASLSTPRRQN